MVTVKTERWGMDDEPAFRDFLAARQLWLSRIAYLLTGDHHAAEDLVQSVLVKVARHWRRVAAADAPDAYLRRMLYNEHASLRRGAGDSIPLAVPPEPAVGPDVADAVVRRLVARRALAVLTPRQRAVLVLRYFEDLSEADTAEVLGCSRGTVKSQTHHALGRLRVLAPELADLVNLAEE
jgi:RNA polymerase sigma-70 factor (sigma-E family)